MNILVLGASGMIGSRIVREAADRGHAVVAASRSGKEVSGALQAIRLSLSDTAKVKSEIEKSDVAIVAIPPDRTGQSHQPTLDAHRALITARPKSRIFIVGGAGSLFIDGVRLKDLPGFPSEYKPEADTFTTILEMYQATPDLDWTFLSPAPVITPGVRSGAYLVGVDSPVGNAISAEDFAVATLDEIEKPQHKQMRFTVAAK